MISKIIVIAWTLFLAYAFLTGIGAIAGGTADAVLAFAIIVSAFVHFGLWCAIAVPTILISRMFRQRPA